MIKQKQSWGCANKAKELYRYIKCKSSLYIFKNIHLLNFYLHTYTSYINSYINIVINIVIVNTSYVSINYRTACF